MTEGRIAVRVGFLHVLGGAEKIDKDVFAAFGDVVFDGFKDFYGGWGFVEKQNLVKRGNFVGGDPAFGLFF